MKPLKSLQTLILVIREYTYLLMKRFQIILYGKFNLEIDISSILVEAKKDIESVQNRVYLLVVSIAKVRLF